MDSETKKYCAEIIEDGKENKERGNKAYKKALFILPTKPRPTNSPALRAGEFLCSTFTCKLKACQDPIRRLSPFFSYRAFKFF